MTIQQNLIKYSANYLRTVVLCLLLCLISVVSNAQTHQYIENNKSIANELSSQYGIPSSIILAIAFVESGGGTSRSSKNFNNHFGIVGKNNPESKYRSFTSVRESYEAFCNIITGKKYYTALKGSRDFSKWTKAIASAGYSARPQEWTNKIHLIISKYRLAML